MNLFQREDQSVAYAPKACAVLLVGLMAFAIGCGEPIKVYETPKEKLAAPRAHAGAAAPAMESPPLPTIKWDKLPSGWTEAPGGMMRVATFSIADKDGLQAAEMAVLPIPKSAGLKELDLVAMWREQLGLAPAGQAEMDKMTQLLEAGGAMGKLYDIKADAEGDGNRILVGAVPDNDWIWFFKLTGRSDVIAEQRQAFEGFLKTIEFVPPKPRQRTAAASRPSAGRPDWKTPAHWEDLGAGMMQLAKYRADGDGGATEISVSRLGGGAGGIPANVNRWRGQLGLDSVSDTEAEAFAKPISVPTGEAKMIELAGDAKAMTVIMVSQGGSIWFFKSMGPNAAVERERVALVEWVESVQYN